MQKSLRKKLSFLLIGFFVFSYQFANIVPASYQAVEAAKKSEVILGGHSIGVNINVDGILILGLSDFYGQDGKKHCPAKEAGLKEGDIIISVGNNSVTTAAEFSDIVDECTGEKISVEYTRNGKKSTTTIAPVKCSEDGKYRLGLWARDGTTGIGTLTFADPNTKRFGALGHGVSDADTGKLITPGKSNIYYASVSNVTKGTFSSPGELQGYFISSEIGDITSNTEHGIFGTLTEEFEGGRLISVASRQEVSTGRATILCCIDSNTVEEFSVNIERVNVNSKDNKSMIIHITDEKLLNSTGGIVQGIGHTLMENVSYDSSGRPRESSFMQYKIPTRLDMGRLKVEFEHSYEPTGPFGAKSIGEIVINTPAPAITHAIYRATGVWHRELPITPEKIAMSLIEK